MSETADDEETINFFARLAYMSELLAPDADKNAPSFDKLPAIERMRLRSAAADMIEFAAQDERPTPAPDAEAKP